jgi:hypothetical protein
MGVSLNISSPVYVKLVVSGSPIASTKINLTQTANFNQPSVKLVIPQVASIPVTKVIPSTKLAVKLVMGQKGDTGASPDVSFVGDQISIDGILGPHLTGPAGPLTYIPENITATASAILGGHRVVQVFNGLASYADKDSDYIGQLGFTMSAYDEGSSMQIFISGVVTEPSWSFTKGPVFLGSNGLITQSIPTTGTVILVGRAVSSTAMSINFQQLYKR